MSQEKSIPETKQTKSLDSLCGVSGLLLSIGCCVTLFHVESVQDTRTSSTAITPDNNL